MSNSSDLLTQLGVQNGFISSLAGNLIGTLADFSGGVGAIAGLIESFESSDNQIAAALSQLQTDLEQGFAQIDATLRATQIVSRQQALVASTAQAEATIQSLPAALKANPPVTEDYKLTQIQNCINALDSLDQDVQWLTVMNDEVYFTGDWSNPANYYFPNVWSVFTQVQVGDIPEVHETPAVKELPPQGNGDGTAFSDRYVLPLFMKELAIFLAVATAFDPNYRVDYSAAITRYANRLIWAYQKSAGGLSAFPTPSPVDIGIAGAPWVPEPNGFPTPTYYFTQQPFIYLTCTPWLGSNDAASWLSVPQPASPDQSKMDEGLFGSPYQATFITGVGQPYGVVHLYSGASNVVAFPPIVGPQSGPPPPEGYYEAFLIRLFVARRARWKELHTSLGLTNVVDTADKLRTMLGEGPFLSPNPGKGWTLREIANLLAQAKQAAENTPPQPVGHVSAADIATKLSKASVTQTVNAFYTWQPSLEWNFRQQLNTLLASTVCSGQYVDALPGGTHFGVVSGLGG